MNLSYKDIDINYSITGNGFPLVLLHGFLHSSTMWKDYIEKWKTSYKIISIDLPGHGKSGIVKNISILEMAKIIDLILKENSIEKTTIIGHSLGGYVGLAFAENYSNKLNKLILLHSSAYADTDLVKKKRNLWLKIIDKHPAMFVRNVIEYLYSKENLEKHKNIVEKYIQEAKDIGYQGYIEAIKAMRDRPERINVFKNNKVFIIAGDNDKVIEKEVSMKQIDLIENGKGYFLQKSSHMGFIEEKDLCFEYLNKILISK